MKAFILALVFISISSLVYGQSKTYLFVFLHKKSSAEQLPQDQIEKIMPGHLANIERLAKEGKLLASGPFEGGGGIFILNTNSMDDAKQWLSTDPGIQAKRWDVEILPYTPRMGSVCLAKEPYEMVTYHFVRFVEKRSSTDENTTDILMQHHGYIKGLKDTLNVITEGVFEPNGNILIAKDNVSDEILESDPAVKQGIISVERKKLWIAKGSFCEQ